VREAVLRFSREVAFSAAEVYARSAESRGAWDARLEALVIDAVVRNTDDEGSIASRAVALGWSGKGQTLVMAGSAPEKLEARASTLRRAGRLEGIDTLLGVHGERAVLILGGEADLVAAASARVPLFGEGPVVIGPLVPSIGQAASSAAAALNGLTAAPAWPLTPRPALADDLLPERVLIGDVSARAALIARVHAPLAAAGGHVLETLETYLNTGRCLEATARELYVHPNTVRYRLRKITDLVGWDPASPRESIVLLMALALGRLDGR